MADILTGAIWLVLLFFVAIPVICASMCAKLAGQRGRDELSWRLLGFFFGIFALVLISILPRNEENLQRSQVIAKEIRKCPHCAEYIKSEATVCRYCGLTVTVQPPLIPTAPTARMLDR